MCFQLSKHTLNSQVWWIVPCPRDKLKDLNGDYCRTGLLVMLTRSGIEHAIILVINNNCEIIINSSYNKTCLFIRNYLLSAFPSYYTFKKIYSNPGH